MFEISVSDGEVYWKPVKDLVDETYVVGMALTLDKILCLKNTDF